MQKNQYFYIPTFFLHLYQFLLNTIYVTQ